MRFEAPPPIDLWIWSWFYNFFTFSFWCWVWKNYFQKLKKTEQIRKLYTLRKKRCYFRPERDQQLLFYQIILKKGEKNSSPDFCAARTLHESICSLKDCIFVCCRSGLLQSKLRTRIGTSLKFHLVLWRISRSIRYKNNQIYGLKKKFILAILRESHYLS
jgi:hypothetical protein